MKKTVLMFGCLMLAGCSNEKPPTIATSIFCDTGDDCTVKFARAVKWVKDTAAYDIASETPTSIVTKGPDPHSPYSAMIVTLKPMKNGLSRIDMGSECSDIFKCTPTSAELQASFAAAVDPAQNQGWATLR